MRIVVDLTEQQYKALTAAVATEVGRLNRLTNKLGSDHEREMHLLDGYNRIRNAWYTPAGVSA